MRTRPFPSSLLLLLPGALGASVFLACAESKPAENAKSMEMVPIAGSASATSAATTTVAHTEPVIETQPVSPAASGSANAKGPTKGGPKVSNAECEAAFDKYLQLMAASDPRLEGLPPEIIAQAKQMAAAQSQGKGGSPCTKNPPSRSQYDCAMAATSAQAWQRCMK
ncbi:MAG: hypothetical protein U0174_06245 [Polyangiaceae bacterium]